MSRSGIALALATAVALPGARAEAQWRWEAGHRVEPRARLERHARRYAGRRTRTPALRDHP
ncbi:MAG: hypothetical protein ACK5Z1_05700 [Gemmatimonadota bacterium]